MRCLKQVAGKLCMTKVLSGVACRYYQDLPSDHSAAAWVFHLAIKHFRRQIGKALRHAFSQIGPVCPY